jgi:hypothetical protein
LILLKSVWLLLKKYANGRKAKLRNQRPLITEPLNQNAMGYSVKGFLGLTKTGNAIVGNIKGSGIKALSVTVVVLR